MEKTKRWNEPLDSPGLAGSPRFRSTSLFLASNTCRSTWKDCVPGSVTLCGPLSLSLGGSNSDSNSSSDSDSGLGFACLAFQCALILRFCCSVALVVAVDTNGYERLINQMHMHDNVLCAPESELAACGKRHVVCGMQQAASDFFLLVYAFIISSMPFMAPTWEAGSAATEPGPSKSAVVLTPN